MPAEIFRPNIPFRREPVFAAWGGRAGNGSIPLQISPLLLRLRERFRPSKNSLNEIPQSRSDEV
jgi:hypothetical protein